MIGPVPLAIGAGVFLVIEAEKALLRRRGARAG